ncbi:Uncharacterised protein [Bordetella pertussis]|nr:Uncharacterised protein [Bordetella pertussis]CFW48232.1 Uncharacterised protein [Bordetella pertussis]
MLRPARAYGLMVWRPSPFSSTPVRTLVDGPSCLP